MEIEAIFSPSKRQVTIKAPVKDSLNASRLADRLNSTDFLKVFDRSFKSGVAVISAYTIKGVFSHEKLQAELDGMESLMNLQKEDTNEQ